MPTFLTATHRRIRPLAAGCAQQQRFDTRTHRVVRWEDTIATDYGSADVIGDDQAERQSSWGALSECATEGGRHREPSATVRDKAPGVLASLLWPIAAVLAIASLAALWP